MGLLEDMEKEARASGPKSQKPQPAPASGGSLLDQMAAEAGPGEADPPTEDFVGYALPQSVKDAAPYALPAIALAGEAYDASVSAYRGTPQAFQDVANTAGGVAWSALESLGKFMDRLDAPIRNVAYNAAEIARDVKDTRFAPEKGYYDPIGKAIFGTGEAVQRGLETPLGPGQYGDNPEDSVTGPQLFALSVYGQDLQKNPEAWKEHPVEILLGGFALEIGLSPWNLFSVSKLSKLAKAYGLVNGAMPDVQAATKAVEMMEAARGAVGNVAKAELAAAEKLMREQKLAAGWQGAASRAGEKLRQWSPAQAVGELAGHGIHRVKAAAPELTARISEFPGNAAAYAADGLRKAPLIGTDATSERAMADAQATLAEYAAAHGGAAYNPATDASKGKNFLDFAGKSILPESVNAGIYKSRQAFDTAVYADGQLAKDIGQYAKTMRGIAGSPRLEKAAEQVGTWIGDATQFMTRLKNKLITTKTGTPEYDELARQLRYSEASVGEDLQDIGQRYDRLARAGFENARLRDKALTWEQFGQEVIRHADPAYHGLPEAEAAFNLEHAINNQIMDWRKTYNPNKELKFLDEELETYINRLATDEAKEWMRETHRKSQSATKGGPTFKLSGKSPNDLSRSLILGQMSVDEANAYMKATYGIDQFYVTDPVVLLWAKLRNTARATLGEQFIDAVKGGGFAKKVVRGSEAKAPGMERRIFELPTGPDKTKRFKLDVPEAGADAIRQDMLMAKQDVRATSKMLTQADAATREVPGAAGRAELQPRTWRDVKSARAEAEALNPEQVVRRPDNNVIPMDPDAQYAPEAPLPNLYDIKDAEAAAEVAARQEKRAYDAAHTNLGRNFAATFEPAESRAAEQAQEAATGIKVPPPPPPAAAAAIPDVVKRPTGSTEPKGWLAMDPLLPRDKFVEPVSRTKGLEHMLAEYQPRGTLKEQIKRVKVDAEKTLKDMTQAYIKRGLHDGSVKKVKATSNLGELSVQGYTQSRNPALQGYAFPAPVTAQLDKTFDNSKKLFDEIEKTKGAIGKVLGWWRMQATWTPRFTLRNVVGNEYNKTLENGLRGENIASYLQTHAAATAHMLGKEASISTPRGPMSVSKVYDDAKAAGAFATGFTSTELKSLDRISVPELLRQGNEAVENEGRFQMILWKLSQGYDMRSAIGAMKHSMFDYGELSEYESLARKWAAFFYTWPRKNVPYQFEMLFKNPGQQRSLGVLTRTVREAFSGYYGERDPAKENLLSQYMLDSMAIPFKKVDGVHKYWLAGQWLPIQDVDMIVTPLALLLNAQPGEAGVDVLRNVLRTAHPAYTSLIAIASNYDPFFRTNIDRLLAADENTKERELTQFGGSVITKRQAYMARQVVAAAWLDKLLDLSAPEIRQEKAGIERVLASLGVNVADVDVELEQARKEDKRNRLEAAASYSLRRTQKNVDAKAATLPELERPGAYRNPLLVQQEEQLQRIKEAGR